MVRIITQKNNISLVTFIIFYILISGCYTNNNSEKISDISKKIESNLAEKPTFIDFYSDTWLVCKASLPGLTTLKKRLENNVNFITYDMDNSDSVEKLKMYRSNVVPTFIVLDANEKIIWKQIGGILNSSQALDALFDCYTEENSKIIPCE